MSSIPGSVNAKMSYTLCYKHMYGDIEEQTKQQYYQWGEKKKNKNCKYNTIQWMQAECL